MITHYLSITFVIAGLGMLLSAPITALSTMAPKTDDTDTEQAGE